MGSPVEVIPGWSAVSEKLDNTLVQLTRLLHYYADETPPADLQDPEPKGKKPGVTEECLDTDMQDILREAQTRLRDFTDTMGLTSGPSVCADRPRLADEDSERSLADAERQVSFLKNELARAQHEAHNLNKCEDIVLKTKDAMETELQRQSQQHKENVQKLHKQMQMQWKELTKQERPCFPRGMEGMCKT